MKKRIILAITLLTVAGFAYANENESTTDQTGAGTWAYMLQMHQAVHGAGSVMPHGPGMMGGMMGQGTPQGHGPGMMGGTQQGYGPGMMGQGTPQAPIGK